MATNVKDHRHREEAKTFSAFFNLLDDLFALALGPMFKWGEKYWQGWNRDGSRWHT
jgi:hypothetical protein